MRNDKIVILGAGLSGLSAAYYLKNKDYEIFEKESEPGGLCRSKAIGGFTFDLDAHLLHFRNRHTFDLLFKLMKGNLKEHIRNSYVYFNNEYIFFPFQAHLNKLSSNLKKECILGLLEAKYDPSFSKKNGNFYAWMLKTFGRGITEHFMLPYNHKFWTIHPRLLTHEWVDKFIPVPTLDQALVGTLTDKKILIGYNNHFLYPINGGINEVTRALAGGVRNLHTQSEAVKIDLLKKEIQFRDGKKVNFGKLITSIPLPELYRLIKPLPDAVSGALRKLKYTSIYNLNLGINRKLFSGTHWIYFPEDKFIFFRIGFFNSFSKTSAPLGQSALYIEISYSKNRPLNKANMYPRIMRDLKKAGIISSADEVVAKDANDIRYGYVIYNKEYQKSRKIILEFLSKNNIYSIGRYGSWQYMSMEDAILDGREIGRRLCSEN
ncbi:MAG: FAD-dependent oxidoreductase [Candidatus Omnitrophota bacterium]